MRFLLCILVLLPIVWCASIDLEERFIFGSLTIEKLAEKLRTFLGSDTSEAACEAGCPTLLATIPGGSVAGALCSPACQYLQTVING